jgi:large subunit ribosomal protein L23
MTRPAAEVVLHPLISEKVYEISEKVEQKVYSFRVARDARKDEIKKAVEALYGVRVMGVRTMWRHGKKRRSRFKFVHKPDWKRALVTLRAGDVIELI